MEQRGYTMKPRFVVVMLLVLALAVPASMLAQGSKSSPPNTPEAKRVKSMVDKAAALVNKKGTAAFPEFRKQGSEWYSGDLYLFAYDPKLNVLLNPAFPEREGKSMAGQEDSKGKKFHDEFLKVVQTNGSGWVDYWFPRPGNTGLFQKWSYVKAIKVDGGIGVIGSGFYPQ
jgi:signal transduction histidine kinase